MPAWAAYLIAFVASGCVLVLEIVAGRVLAPYVGASLYTWTGIIAVVLAGLALGNYLGGIMSDRWTSARVPALILLGSGCLTLLAPLLVGVIDLGPLRSLHPTARILLGPLVGFFPPTALLGAVTPMVTRLLMRDVEHSGSLVGRVYGFATVGSIAGTFLCGYVLLDLYGVRTIIAGVGATLLGLGLLVLVVDRVFERRSAVVVAPGQRGRMQEGASLD